jgi:hypothetical protein
VCWSLYVGREFCIPTPTTDTEAFKVISKPLVDYDYDQLPWVHPSSKLEPQPNYLTKTFEATCELLTIARRIMDVVYVFMVFFVTITYPLSYSNRLDRSHSRPLAINELITEIESIHALLLIPFEVLTCLQFVASILTHGKVDYPPSLTSPINRDRPRRRISS